MGFAKQCNLETEEKLHRIIIGLIILLAALLGFGKVFFMIVGILLAVSGIIGWCSIPFIMEKLKIKKHQ